MVEYMYCLPRLTLSLWENGTPLCTSLFNFVYCSTCTRFKLYNNLLIRLPIRSRATENRFFAGSDRFIVCKTDSICIKRIFFGPKKTHFADHILAQFPGLVKCQTVNCPQLFQLSMRGARWLSGRVSDSGARGPGFETYLRRVVSLSKTLYSPKVLVNYPGSDGSVPT